MIGLFVKRPAMTLMFVLVFVVMGIVSYSNLIIESTPRIEFPLVTIRTEYTGATPEEIETQIIKKLEDAVSEISAIKKIESYAYENYGFIIIEFEIGSDVNIKSIEVKDKVEPVINDLPYDAQKPVIAKFDPLVEPIIDLILTGEGIDGRTLYEYADKNIKDRITTTEGVASVDIFGGKERQINVWLDHMMMKKYFIATNSVVYAINKRNVTIPGGTIDQQATKSSVRLVGEFDTVDQIRNMNIVSAEGNRLRLHDIATVEDSYKTVETYTRFNNQDVVGLSIKKLSDGDAVTIVEKLKKTIGEIRETLPDHMKLAIAYDSTVFILTDTHKTVQNIFFGIILTVLILFVFLGDWRVTVIASVVIPTSLISAFFLMDLSEFSINFMTLLAIATSLGTLIANALVVIENVDMHMAQGKTPVQAAVDGTKGAAVAVFASAGTNLVVFTPIAFMGGIVGQFMQQFGLTVVYATIFSILASFSLTPMLCGLLLRPRRETTKKTRSLLDYLRTLSESALASLIAEYHRVFKKLFSYPKTALLICLLLLIGGCYPLSFIGSEFVPASDQDKIKITVEMPQGTLVEKTLHIVENIEDIVSQLPEVTSYLSYVGIDGPETASITVNLTPALDRSRSDLDLINVLIPEAAKIPDAEISFSRGDSGPSEADMTIDIYGEDYDT
ncbi:MAG: hypothetical protein GF384_08015, partial [Elusimicrobia bacterium]|nr:hypothetical protein [Elusimicrobiota bacterium]MBD3412580.1 hypothetical protein [Elusimicrobiota bacterium]